MVDVAAPATLPAGYTFDAIYDGVTFPVKVVSWSSVSLNLYTVVEKIYFTID